MDRTAFVTGASSGIGRALALRLAAAGWQVGVAARRMEALAAVVDEVESAGGRALATPCDVAERDQVRSAVADVTRTLGPVDLLVSNAGITGMSDARALSAAEVEHKMRVNFLGAVYATEAVLPGMLERGRGQLVAIGSLAGYGGLPLTAGYSASKGALHNFFESVRIDLRGTGVDVTVITPGYVQTAMTDLHVKRPPFVVELDGAADRMMRAIERRRRLYTFPRPLSTIVWWAQALPAGLYDLWASRVDRRKRS